MKINSIFRVTAKQDQPVFVVAEVSANHAQNLYRALGMIKVARDCGVDAVKFQAYTPGTLTINADNKYFRIRHPRWGGQTLYELYKKACTPWKWLKRLKKTADDLGMTFLCTAYDKTSVDFLEDLNICAHKIASFELVDLPLIEYVAKTGKPLIISTGMASIREIREAVNTARRAGAKKIILLKCVSGYPAKPEDMNLKTILHMKKLFNCPVGLSDHSLGIGVSVCAVVLGAVLIEKHFTLSRKIRTPDSFFSIEPRELKQLVESVRIAQKVPGSVCYGTVPQEEKMRCLRRSLFVVQDVLSGEKVTSDNVKSIRPGYGLHSRYLRKITGRVFKKAVRKGTPFSWDLIQKA